jgi:hypothetical protein
MHHHGRQLSRRIGLVERLHPELVEQIRNGILPPGAARPLLGLRAGNQLVSGSLASAFASAGGIASGNALWSCFLILNNILGLQVIVESVCDECEMT